MAHWIDKKQKTRISDADYNILSKGMKNTIGAEGNTFGLSSKDYIEMNIFSTTGTFLESIRLDEPKQYINVVGEFEINPGVILRRNGYFSGDYDIEFAFFREIAGSNQNVLVDSNKEIYTGEYDVTIDGRILKEGTNKELEELEYKYFVHQISNDKREIRLATLPINNEVYKREFEGLGEQESVIYPKTIGQDVLNFDNPSSNNSKEFVLNNNSNIQLTKDLIGGELIINDAFEIMDLSDLNQDNDGFGIFLQDKGGKQNVYGNYQAGNDNINFGDKNNLSTKQDFINYCFQDLGIDDGDGSGKAGTLSDIVVELKSDLGDASSGRPLLGGAYLMGYKTSKNYGFPFRIDTTISDLDKIAKLDPKLKIKIKGIDLVSGDEFESTFSPKFYGNGTKGTIPIPQNHKSFGGLYSAEFNLTFDINGTRRGITIYRPNLFAVIPDYKISDEESEPAKQFIRQGFNY